MEVMGGLIVLDRKDTLPIPWFMRSHLGLQSGCKVSFALTQVQLKNQLPDIVVSPLDPRHFHEITSITLANSEGIGTLAEVIREVESPINIALADSVTIEGRARHRINLVIEKADGAERESYVDRRTSFIRRFSFAPGAYDYDLEVTEIDKSQRTFTAPKMVRVKNGCVHIGDLLHQIRSRHVNIVDEYDLGKLVVSSNPDQRILRYIIPRKGVVTIKIPHEDAPGVLRTILEGVGSAGYNILCSRLSRVPPDESIEKASVFVAECEPGPDAVSPKELIERLVTDTVYLGHFEYGVRARDCLYLRPPHSVVALPQQSYIEGIKAELRKLRLAEPAYRGGRRHSVFISRRFIETKPDIDANVTTTYEKLLKALEKGVREAGWALSSAPPDYAGKPIDNEIYPRLWVSDALVVIAFHDDASGRLSHNQAHELGFYMGQNKPTAILIDNAKIKDFNVSNYAGRQILDYQASVAFHDDYPGSISARVKDWLEKVAHDL
jgi:hypothetical protein